MQSLFKRDSQISTRNEWRIFSTKKSRISLMMTFIKNSEYLSRMKIQKEIFSQSLLAYDYRKTMNLLSKKYLMRRLFMTMQRCSKKSSNSSRVIVFVMQKNNHFLVISLSCFLQQDSNKKRDSFLLPFRSLVLSRRVYHSR